MKQLTCTYESYIDNVTYVNSSFDKGVLKVAYHGLNRNNSNISKETFEDAVPSMYNVPVVVHYMPDEEDWQGKEGDFGGHDSHIEIKDNEILFVNETEPVGVVPESAKHWWEVINNKEYFCVDVFIWKRQAAYQKIKEMKTVNHSMEITILDGNFVKGKNKDESYYDIKKMEFTAFCLLSDSVEPCFEDSKLELYTFNKDKFKTEFNLMLCELKETLQYKSQLIPQEVKSNVQKGLAQRKMLGKGGNTKTYRLAQYLLKNETISEEKMNEIALQFSNSKSDIDFLLLGGDVGQQWLDYKLKYSEKEERIVDENKEEMEVKMEEMRAEVSEDTANMEVKAEEDMACGDEAKMEVENPEEDKSETPEDEAKEDYKSMFEELNTKYAELESKYAELEGKNGESEKELHSLKEFKLAIEVKEKESLFEKFSKQLSEDEMKSIKEKSSELSVEEVEGRLFTLVGKKTFSLNTDSTEMITMGLTDVVETKTSGKVYEDILKKYAK